jgi:hypothetical protein
MEEVQNWIRLARGAIIFWGNYKTFNVFPHGRAKDFQRVHRSGISSFRQDKTVENE